MQFIEKNGYDVRSAFYRLKKDGSDIEFLLFPIVHVGSPEFYAQVSNRLASCDVILAEGVKSRKVQYLTHSYRVVKKIRRMELVTQCEALRMSAFRHKVVNADLGGDVFDQKWSRLPLSLRLMIALSLPIYVARLFFRGTRESLAEQMSLDDLPSREEALMYAEGDEAFDKLLIEGRDRKLIEEIERIIETGAREKKVVGILYGAMHMRSVMRHLLRKRRYRVATAEWVTVFYL